MKIWSLISISGNLQYGGNTGYLDEPSRKYRYDDHVANHKKVIEGDFVFIRSRSRVLGVAVVESISRFPDQKLLYRCPVCSTTKLKQRKRDSKDWLCSTGHTFVEPLKDQVSTTAFEASYGNSYRALNDQLKVSDL
jgi:putative restriction endonuclease